MGYIHVKNNSRNYKALKNKAARRRLGCQNNWNLTPITPITLAERARHITLLTNHFELPTSHIAELYKSRWQVELFFKWIKQNLRIKAFVGTSANAVKTQIWCAVCTYVVVAIVKKRLALEGSMHAILQVLSLSLFEVKPLAELLGEQLLNDETGEPEAQFCLFPEISGQ